MLINNTQEPKIQRYLNSKIFRWDIINYLIGKHNFLNYLEIGVFKGECIEKIVAPHKDGVDPLTEGFSHPLVNYPITSDHFFDYIQNNPEIKYDIIFIDGLHHSSQVKTDIINSLKHVKEDGFIILHDCNPQTFSSQVVPRQTVCWTGDVWKAFVGFKQSNPNTPICTIDTDWGVGIIKVTDITTSNFHIADMEWEDFDQNRNQLLNLMSWDDFKATYK